MKCITATIAALLLASLSVVRADLNCLYPGYGVAQAQANLISFHIGIPTNELEYYAAPLTNGRQRHPNWCWAACTQMVLNYLGLHATQEEVVQRIYGAQVDAPATFQQMVAALSGWGRNNRGGVSVVTASSYVPTTADIVSDLCQRHPLIVSMKASANKNHAMVLTAVTYRAGLGGLPHIDRVVLRDPWPSNQSRVEMTWDQFAMANVFMLRVLVQNY